MPIRWAQRRRTPDAWRRDASRDLTRADRRMSVRIVVSVTELTNMDAKDRYLVEGIGKFFFQIFYSTNVLSFCKKKWTERYLMINNLELYFGKIMSHKLRNFMSHKYKISYRYASVAIIIVSSICIYIWIFDISRDQWSNLYL